MREESGFSASMVFHVFVPSIIVSLKLVDGDK